jgi:archaellin
MTKKAEVGIGAMLLMISILLVVLVFVGLFLNAANKLETQGYRTAEKTKRMIATKILPDDLQSEYADGYLQNFTVNLKLSPGSEESIYLEDLVFTLTTDDEKTTYSYAGIGSYLNHSAGGFNTLTTETVPVPYTLKDDYDGDGLDDLITAGPANAVNINLSGGENIQLGTCTAPTTWSYGTYDSENVKNATGTCVGSVVTEVTLVPDKSGRGVYSVEYLITSDLNQAGRLGRGEVIKVYFESQNLIGVDEEGLLNFVPKTGTETSLSFYVPDVDGRGKAFLSHY